jgi:hypothetical protein
MNQNTTPWSDTAKILALVMCTAFIVVILLWMFFPPKTDAGATAVLNTMVGALGSTVAMIISYYFGSSRSGASKDSTIASLVVQPPAQPAAADGTPAVKPTPSTPSG